MEEFISASHFKTPETLLIGWRQHPTQQAFYVIKQNLSLCFIILRKLSTHFKVFGTKCEPQEVQNAFFN